MWPTIISLMFVCGLVMNSAESECSNSNAFRGLYHNIFNISEDCVNHPLQPLNSRFQTFNIIG